MKGIATTLGCLLGAKGPVAEYVMHLGHRTWPVSSLPKDWLSQYPAMLCKQLKEKRNQSPYPAVMPRTMPTLSVWNFVALLSEYFQSMAGWTADMKPLETEGQLYGLYTGTLSVYL